MNYKELYKELAQLLTSMRCCVCDHDFFGYCYQIENFRAFIVIKAKMTYKEKYFTLIHEVGHLFYMNKGNILNWSKRVRTEKEANWFAFQILRINDIDVDDYKEFYNRANRILKNRKKSWHEI